MDRLVSAYRNKLECRAGKEYYYKVKSLQKSVHILLIPTQFIFEETLLQEHGQKAVQSYRKAGKLKFGEER